MTRLLFLCVGNSARSQMAEGLARKRFGPKVDVQSAGSKPTGLNPLAVRAMEEVSIDISSHRSKSIDSIDLELVDTVVTLCAEEVCPVVPGDRRQLHWALPDPGAATGSADEQLAQFREIRDEIDRRLDQL